MKSPITGKEMKMAYEWRLIPFRKDQINVKYLFYLCEDSGEHFTTTELDELNMKLVHNQYRVKHRIPTVEEIKEIREQYDISALKMSEILGFGPNTYRLYESGDVPNIPNANLIKLAWSPLSFKKLVNEWLTTDIKYKTGLLNKIDRLIEDHKKHFFYRELVNYLMGVMVPDQFSGFRKPSLERLTEMIVFFAHKVPSYKTKMNKLLFYSDFYFFKNYGYSISGTKYSAIPYGPVPNNFQSIFEKLVHEDVIDCHYDFLKDGNQIEKLVGRQDRPFNADVFNEEELNALNIIVDRFKNISTQEIVKLSHEELGWIENNENKGQIDYNYAFDLKAI